MTSLPDIGVNRLSLRGSLYVGGGVEHPGAVHARNVAKLARERSGEWVDLAIRMTRKNAQTKAGSIRKSPPAAFRPVEAFEVLAESRDDGWAVKVRFVGWPP